jgi:hypothetical protein
LLSPSGIAVLYFNPTAGKSDMSNFWDMVWLMISTFFFVAYLIIMFQIVADLFRDPELGGGSKCCG